MMFCYETNYLVVHTFIVVHIEFLNHAYVTQVVENENFFLLPFLLLLLIFIFFR